MDSLDALVLKFTGSTSQDFINPYNGEVYYIERAGCSLHYLLRRPIGSERYPRLIDADLNENYIISQLEHLLITP